MADIKQLRATSMDYKQTHHLWMDVAIRVAQESHARRTKVGAVLVRDGNMISQGWNGTPPGFDNSCEIEIFDSHLHDGYTEKFFLNNGYIWSEEKQDWYRLVTKPEVLHAEINILKHCLRSGTSTVGATMYQTLSPCPVCANILIGLNLKELIYKDVYRDEAGIEILRTSGLKVTKFSEIV